jgi:hypothetical protein
LQLIDGATYCFGEALLAPEPNEFTPRLDPSSPVSSLHPLCLQGIAAHSKRIWEKFTGALYGVDMVLEWVHCEVNSVDIKEITNEQQA